MEFNASWIWAAGVRAHKQYFLILNIKVLAFILIIEVNTMVIFDTENRQFFQIIADTDSDSFVNKCCYNYGCFCYTYNIFRLTNKNGLSSS